MTIFVILETSRQSSRDLREHERRMQIQSVLANPNAPPTTAAATTTDSWGFTQHICSTQVKLSDL